MFASNIKYSLLFSNFGVKLASSKENTCKQGINIYSEISNFWNTVNTKNDTIPERTRKLISFCAIHSNIISRNRTNLFRCILPGTQNFFQDDNSTKCPPGSQLNSIAVDANLISMKPTPVDPESFLQLFAPFLFCLFFVVLTKLLRITSNTIFSSFRSVLCWLTLHYIC